MNYKNAAIRKKIVSQTELTLIKQVHQKNVCFAITGTSKMLDLSLNCIFVTNVTIY